MSSSASHGMTVPQWTGRNPQEKPEAAERDTHSRPVYALVRTVSTTQAIGGPAVPGRSPVLPGYAVVWSPTPLRALSQAKARTDRAYARSLADIDRRFVLRARRRNLPPL